MIAFFKRYVVHNFGLKVLSLLLATGLWFLISPDEQPAEVAVRAPIVFEHVPSQLEISTEAIPEAQIRVRGPERVIRQLQANEIHAEIELAGAKPGERTFDLTSQQVRHPRDVTVVQVVPSQLHLAFDSRSTREVEIHPRVTGNFADGEQIVKVDADPARITITGPRHHVEKVDSATTDPVDATGTRGSAVFTTNVYVPDPLVQVVQTTSIRVTVLVQKVGSATTH
ncbi:MAG TPA: CdaR family protein [Candidatus Sulfotelmatobacter sp.]|jgi:YbbR domain-containing protein|nr:CdaR family protein [Candidatus Sulfotelmatobacter sp.]